MKTRVIIENQTDLLDSDAMLIVVQAMQQAGSDEYKQIAVVNDHAVLSRPTRKSQKFIVVAL